MKCKFCKNKVKIGFVYCHRCRYGGISNITGGRDYVREQVRIRDRWTCQKCKIKWKKGERRFDVHHLNGLCGKMSTTNRELKDISGLITYCHKCHLNLHSVKKKMVSAKKKEYIKKEEIKKLIEMRKKGSNYQEIGLKFGLKKQNTYALIKRHSPDLINFFKNPRNSIHSTPLAKPA